MKVLFICGYFDKNEERDIINNSKGNIHYSANLFQQRIIDGFKENNVDITILSAPFVGTFPLEYKKIIYFPKSDENYVSFFNLWAIRNYFRYRSLEKKVKKDINIREYNYIFVYAPHTPFMKLNKKIKIKQKNCKSILIIPDLPQFMNLNKNKSIVYTLLKKLDIKLFYNLNNYFDKYILLTKEMNKIINKLEKDNLVIEAITADNIKISNSKIENSLKTIVYTGRINESFGVKNLIESFLKIKDSNINLIICGNGDLNEYIKEKQFQDNRIKFYGQVSKTIARNFELNASLLINPRLNDSEYTKYSFPSKNLEYLSTGNKTLCYKLDGIPDEYDNFLYYIDEYESLEIAIKENLNHNFNKYTNAELQKFLESKSCTNQIKKILEFISK